MSSVTCPTCAADWPGDFRFCPKDGAELPLAVEAAPKVSRDAPTVLQVPVVTPPEPRSEEPSARRDRGRFSETAWFMKKIDPSMVDPKTGRVKAPDALPSVEQVDPETRKKYSLRKDDEE